MGTKERVYIRKEFNSQRIGLQYQHGRRFIVLEHRYGRPDVIWKRSVESLCNGDGEQQKSNRFRLAKEQLCTCITLLSAFLFLSLNLDTVFSVSPTMKLNKIDEVWNNAYPLFKWRFGLLWSRNFATMATWRNDFSLLGQNDQKISTGPSFFLIQYNVEYVIHRIKVISLKRPMFSFNRN